MSSRSDRTADWHKASHNTTSDQQTFHTLHVNLHIPVLTVSESRARAVYTPVKIATEICTCVSQPLYLYGNITTVEL